MKTKARKQEDLNALTEQLKNSKSAMIVSFNKLTVTKDQEIREQLRGIGAQYQVVKNTIARRAVEGTRYEGAAEHFKGVSAIAWTNEDAVVLSKTVSKFVKDNGEIFKFKAGIVDGKVVDLKQVEAIASLPSKEVLISKLLFVLNAQAQRLATVINAVPRNLAIVIKQIGEAKPEVSAAQTSEPQAAAQETAPAAQTEESKPESTEEISAPSSEAEVSPAAEVESEKSVETETAQESTTEATEEPSPEEKSE